MATAAISLVACGPEAPAPTDVTVPVAAPAKGPRHDEIMNAIKVLTDRQACNRVTGCDKLVDLFQFGGDLIAPAAEALARPDRGNGHWTIVLPEALGQLGDPRATEPLVGLLSDRRWEVRIAAAVGLGHLGAKAQPALSELTRLAALPDNEPLAGGDLAFRVALEFALMRVDGANAAVHRELLKGFMPLEHTLQTPPPILDILVAIAGHARLSEALPMVRLALTTGNRFIVATALDVAGGLQDNGAIVNILPLLDDPNPTLRKLAAAALSRISGATFDTADQWRAWAVRVGVTPAN